MIYPPCSLYVIQCETPRHYYVGTTNCRLKKRLDEHFIEKKGALWTTRHGCKRVVKRFTIPIEKANYYENLVWLHYARIYGAENVRGGDVTILGPIEPFLKKRYPYNAL